MKKNKVLKLVVVAALGFLMTSCGLNSTDDSSLVANQIRSSRLNGGSSNFSGLAIDLRTGRPALNSTKWIWLDSSKFAIESFLSINEGGQSVILTPEIYNSTDVFFWGNLKSTQSPVLQIGNLAAEREYFESLDTDSFKFELAIWDKFTGVIDPQTNQKGDFLGYAYFAKDRSSSVGRLAQSVVVASGSDHAVVIKFSDAVGDLLLEFRIARNQSRPELSKMTGAVSFREGNNTNTRPILLGNFYNHNVCDLFKCQ